MLIAGLIAAHMLLFTWHIAPPLLDGDDAVYLLMADTFSPFSVRGDAVTSLVMRHSYFPPLYPLLLGLAGGVSSSAVLAHGITVACMFAAIVGFYVWAREIVESRLVVLVLAWLIAVFPATMFQLFSLSSEGLYLILTFTALVLASRAPDSAYRQPLTAVAIGLAIVSRTVGFALWLAYALWLVFGRRKGWKTLPWLALLPWFGWSVWKWAHGYSASYGGNLAELLAHKSLWNLLSDQLLAAPRFMWQGWVSSFDHLGSRTGAVAATIVGALCLAGLARRLWLRTLDGLYVAIYLGVLLVWPYPYEARRLLFVIVPILLVHGWTFAVWVGAQLRSVPRWEGAFGILYVVLIGISTVPAIYSIHDRLVLGWRDANRAYAVAASWYTYARVEDARTRIAEQMSLVRAWRTLGSKLAADECVYHLKPVAFMLYANRPAYATPHADNQTEFWARATQCRHFYLGAFVYPPYRGAFYPRQYLGPDIETLSIDYLGGEGRKRPLGMLVRVDRAPNGQKVHE